MFRLLTTQGLKPAKVKDIDSGKFLNDYWETSKKMLSDMGFLDSLRSYDKVGGGLSCGFWEDEPGR